MKTLLFTAGLCFNLFLCFYPFEEIQHSMPSEKITEPSGRNPERMKRNPLSYSALLKGKASELQKD